MRKISLISLSAFIGKRFIHESFIIAWMMWCIGEIYSTNCFCDVNSWSWQNFCLAKIFACTAPVLCISYTLRCRSLRDLHYRRPQARGGVSVETEPRCVTDLYHGLRGPDNASTTASDIKGSSVYLATLQTIAAEQSVVDRVRRWISMTASRCRFLSRSNIILDIQSCSTIVAV